MLPLPAREGCRVLRGVADASARGERVLLVRRTDRETGRFPLPSLSRIARLVIPAARRRGVASG